VCIASDGVILNSQSDRLKVEFSIIVDPQCQRFEIRLFLEPKSVDRSIITPSMSISFLAYDEVEPEEPLPEREPYKWLDQKGQAPPSGPLSFSRQLRDVKFRNIEDAEREAGFKLPRVGNTKFTDAQHRVFSWKSSHFVPVAHSRDVSGYSPEVVEAVEVLKRITASIGSGSTLYAVFALRHSKSSDRAIDTYWPRFAALPSPSPPDY
jgi:hypothetical protein